MFRAEMERLSVATSLPIVAADAVGEVQRNEAPIAVTGNGWGASGREGPTVLFVA